MNKKQINKMSAQQNFQQQLLNNMMSHMPMGQKFDEKQFIKDSQRAMEDPSMMDLMAANEAFMDAKTPEERKKIAMKYHEKNNGLRKNMVVDGGAARYPAN